MWNRSGCPNTRSNAKMLAFYHKKGIDMLKLRCPLPILEKICLHKSTSAKFYPFTETDKDFLQKIREDLVGGSSIVFTRKAVVDESFIRNSGNICKSIVGIDASQLYPDSICQPMPRGLYTRLEYDTESNMFQLNKTNLETLRTWLSHISKDKNLTVKLRVSEKDWLLQGRWLPRTL